MAVGHRFADVCGDPPGHELCSPSGSREPSVAATLGRTVFMSLVVLRSWARLKRYQDYDTASAQRGTSGPVVKSWQPLRLVARVSASAAPVPLVSGPGRWHVPVSVRASCEVCFAVLPDRLEHLVGRHSGECAIVATACGVGVARPGTGGRTCYSTVVLGRRCADHPRIRRHQGVSTYSRAASRRALIGGGNDTSRMASETRCDGVK